MLLQSNTLSSSNLVLHQWHVHYVCLSPLGLALEAVGTGAVVPGPLLVPGQHVHQQVGAAHTGLPPLWSGITHWKQQLCRKQHRGDNGTLLWSATVAMCNH